MKKYRCKVCGYLYDPQVGDAANDIPSGVPFAQLPDGWSCPCCREGAWAFEEVAD